MELIAIQMGITAVLLIAHFFRLVWDRIFPVRLSPFMNPGRVGWSLTPGSR